MSLLEPDANDPEHTFYVNGLTLSCMCGWVKDTTDEKWIDGLARRHLILHDVIHPTDEEWIGPVQKRNMPEDED